MIETQTKQCHPSIVFRLHKVVHHPFQRNEKLRFFYVVTYLLKVKEFIFINYKFSSSYIPTYLIDKVQYHYLQFYEYDVSYNYY